MLKKHRRNLLLAFLMFLVSIIGYFFVFAAGEVVLLTGTFGDAHLTGSFSTGGNAGQTSFDNVPSGYSGAQIIGITGSSGAYLTGIFWLQTVGWATFEDTGFGPVSIIPPASGQNIRDPWYLSGYVWSANAGWIKLNHGETNASGVIFLPDSRSLVGFGWSDNLGWISFTSGTVGVGSGFLGGISVGGGIGGTHAFSVLNSLQNPQTDASVGTFLNQVRKNVALITRNAEKNNKIGTGLSLVPNSFNNSLIYKIDSNPSDNFLRFSNITSWDNVTDKNRSLIVVGADIYMDTGTTVPSYIAKARSIIALKNDLGQGGDIYIKGSVKNLETTLVSEGTIWSGDEAIAGQLSPYISTKTSIFTSVPHSQLYIKGSVVSYNTIGGSSKTSGASCPSILPSTESSCTYDTALKYDWNYFRSFDGITSNRAYPNNSKDTYSVVMEYDPRVSQGPPPGLENIRY